MLIMPAALADTAPSEKLRGELPQVLEQAGADDLIPVSVILGDQLTGEALRARAEGITDRDERRQVLIAALEDHSAATQFRVREIVRSAKDVGRARDVKFLWIANVVAAELTRAEIEKIAALPEVDRINWAPQREVFLERPPLEQTLPSTLETTLDPVSCNLAPGAAGTDADEIECGVELMRAPEVWNDLGVTGEGAVVAVIDSGVCWYHSDIENQIWVNPGEDLDGDGVVMDEDDLNGIDDDGNGYVDDLIGYDIENRDHDPNDNNSHGSHCAGTVAGDGTAGHQSGMASDAKIMAIRVGLSTSDEPDVWEAMEYASENGADAITMSLGWQHSWNPDRRTWREGCENAIELGTAMVIAAGNEGSGNEPDNVRTPGDVPRIISVGAVDCSDNIASFSSRGPVTWQDVDPWFDHPYPPGLVKPDVSAPGVSTRSHNLCDGYSNKSGTSMATPHVAGAVALMISSNPGLEHDDIKFLLEETAIDLGEPGKDNVYGTGRVDAYEAVLRSASSDGVMSIREKSCACEDVLNLSVSDVDLKGTGTLDVEVMSTTETTPEIVTLIEAGDDSGVFKGEVSVATGDPTPDGVVQVTGGDVVTATYIDADDGEGGVNVPKTDTADVDCTAPVISGVRTEDIGLYAATVRWETDEASTSVVNYGELKPPDQTKQSGGYTSNHSVRLDGLQECTVYYYEVESGDRLENTASDDNGGSYYYFETYGDFGNGPQSCHAGQVVVEANVYSCSDTVVAEVSDLDLNTDAELVETTTLEVTSTTESTPEIVTATETGPNTSTFRATIATGSGAVQQDGVLQLSDGDVITVTYMDADDGTGRPQVSFDTADADCYAPVINDLRVVNVTDARVTVRWETDEAADAVIEWGPTPALGESITRSGLATSHSLIINDLTGCSEFYFRVSSTDAHGYTAWSGTTEAPHHFHSGMIPGLYYKADFESGADGWDLQGEWETGAPQGLGGSTGSSDPLAAYNNNAVLGHDLSGQGAYGGDYEASVSETASSPVLDSSTWTNTELVYYRQLQAGDGDEASLWVWTDAGRPLYRSEGRVDERSFQRVSIDLSSLDGAPTMKFDFKQRSDGSGQYAGWNVDEFIIKDGSQPDYAACATCGSTPEFLGAASAIDNDACGASGVTVSWQQAVSWGSDDGGTYAVYRGSSPGFPADAGHLVASGVSGLSYNDTAAPTDQDLYYLVRAESGETCGSGPNNGGTMDDNSVYARVTESTSQPAPGAIVDADVTVVGHAHVRLTWPAASSAATYRIYRSESPDPGSFTLIDETGDLMWEDVNAAGNKKTYFYDVRAVNACGAEGE